MRSTMFAFPRRKKSHRARSTRAMCRARRSYVHGTMLKNAIVDSRCAFPLVE